MGKFNLEKVKSTENEIKHNIEEKKIENAKLEESKEQLMEAGFEIQDSNLSDEVTSRLMEYINEDLSKIKQEGREKSAELDEDMKKLLDIQTEVTESREENQEQKNKLEKKKDALDKFGLGGVLEKPVEELNRNEMNLSEVSENLRNTYEELMTLSRELSSK